MGGRLEVLKKNHFRKKKKEMLVLRKQRFMGLFLEKEDLTLKNPMIFMVRGSLCNLFYFILFLLWKI